MNYLKQILRKSQHIILYAVILAVLVFILKWFQWRYIISDYSIEIYIGLIAIFFTILGIWVATQLTKSKVKTVVVEKEVYIPEPEGFFINEVELKKLNLTTREYEVLQHLVQAMSNAEIADSLSLSVSTVKTHVSNLLVKMNVKSRTQAVEKAKRLRITP